MAHSFNSNTHQATGAPPRSLFRPLSPPLLFANIDRLYALPFINQRAVSVV